MDNLFKFIFYYLTMVLNLEGVSIEWLGNSGFRIKIHNKVAYIDPYQVSSAEEADLILLTHSHYDHCSISDINKIAKNGTTIICPADCQSSITKIGKEIDMQLIEAGNTIKIGDIKIEAVPAYNNTKHFHPKSEGWLGYVIEIGSIVIYHAGDTDLIKEMEKLTGFAKRGNKFIALLPVSGNFTMGINEAAEAAERIHADIVIPMHYAAVSGKEDDGKKFVEVCRQKGINARLI